MDALVPCPNCEAEVIASFAGDNVKFGSAAYSAICGGCGGAVTVRVVVK